MKKIKYIVIIAIFCILLLLSLKFILKKHIYKDDYIEYITYNNLQNGIDPYLILSIIKTESKFNTNVTSAKGAKGLMQIMDDTCNDVRHITNLSDINLYDPEINIKIGINYFNLLIKRYNGNYYLAICAYNAGIGNVDKWIKEGILDENLDTCIINSPFKETNGYLKKVINNYKMYKVLY